MKLLIFIMIVIAMLGITCSLCSADWKIGTRWFTPTVVASGFVGNNTQDDGTALAPEPHSDKAAWDTFSATATGQISYVHVYLESASADKYFNIAVYDSAGTTLLADSTLRVGGSNGWFHFQLDSPINVVSGTSYSLSVGSKDDSYFAIGTKGGGGECYVDNSYDVENTMPASVAKDSTTANYNLSIYADNSAT